MDQRAIDNERSLRFALWGALQSGDGPDAVDPAVLQQMQIYRGQRGMFADKTRTTDLSEDGSGVVVSLRHTGLVYDDDLSDDGIIYRYPVTSARGRDASDIAATKNAAVLGIPVFVVANAVSAPGRRRVRLGWVSEWDDNTGQFLVVFGEEPVSAPSLPEDDAPFVLIEKRPRKSQVSEQRIGQARFHFDVMRRYGPSCALCDIRLVDVLDTPHVVPVKNRGTNDPRNGLVMCATHHRAFDAHLFGIEPESLAVCYPSRGFDARSLRISVGSLAGLSKRPHPEALVWRWEHWRQHTRV